MHGDALGLRVTPAVFAVTFALGAWSDSVGLLEPWVFRSTRYSFAVAAGAALLAALWPSDWVRFAALGFGTWACLSRGVALLSTGASFLPRKSELVMGGVWMAVGYLLLWAWVVTVPAQDRWSRDRR